MSKEFFEEMDSVFKEILNTDKNKILIVDSSTNLPVEGIKYDKVFFDSELNIYKFDKEGKLIKVNNPKFKAIIKE